MEVASALIILAQAEGVQMSQRRLTGSGLSPILAQAEGVQMSQTRLTGSGLSLKLAQAEGRLVGGLWVGWWVGGRGGGLKRRTSI